MAINGLQREKKTLIWTIRARYRPSCHQSGKIQCRAKERVAPRGLLISDYFITRSLCRIAEGLVANHPGQLWLWLCPIAGTWFDCSIKQHLPSEGLQLKLSPANQSETTSSTVASWLRVYLTEKQHTVDLVVHRGAESGKPKLPFFAFAGLLPACRWSPGTRPIFWPGADE